MKFSRHKREEVVDLVRAFTRAKVLCLGDVMLDRFVEGEVNRISPESPVPVFNAIHETTVVGGAANVARNIEALGGLCTLVGIVGEDDAAASLWRILRRVGGISPSLVTVDDRPTIVKTRFVTRGHHMLRVDHEQVKPIAAQAAQAILGKIASLIDSHDVLILSDYAKGVLSDVVIRESIALAQKAGIPIVVDPKSADFGRYSGANLISPNIKELQLATGKDCGETEGAISAARQVLREIDIGAVLMTRGEKGMVLVTREADAFAIPTFAREVYDVVGAGDTVVATLSLAIACKATLNDSVVLANTAAGIVVGKRGTATISPEELIHEIDAHADDAGPKGRPVVLALDEIVRYAKARKAEGKKVGFTNGVFDIVHPGHISILQFSRDACDCLIVGVNSDASVRRLKGPTRPVNTEDDRATVVGAFGMVDAVTVFDSDTPLEIIRAIQPDVLIKGADYTIGTVVGSDVVLQAGGEVLLAPLVQGASSSNIIKRAQLDKQ